MKKLTLATIIAAAFSLSAHAGHHGDKESEMKNELNEVGLSKIHSSFDSLDNDNDGFISREEADDDQIWEHFSNIDGILDDKTDGVISQDEFSKYMGTYTGKVATDDEIIDSANVAKITKLDPIIHSFDEIDDDKSGFISIEEADGHKIDVHFGYIDDNEDMIVTKEEFMNYLSEEGTVTEE